MPSAVDPESVIKISAITDVGKVRAHNEDNFIVCPDLGEDCWFIEDKPAPLNKKGCLLVVADGMGGTNAGEVASKIAVDTMQEIFSSLEIPEDIAEQQARDFLHQAIIEAHKAIVASSSQNIGYRGMGTTVVVAWVFPGKAYIAWCGDSRAYLYEKKNGLKLITNDHSLVWEMVEAGKITPEEADIHPDNNIITQALGDLRRLPQPDFTVCSMKETDRLLLCSDGLNNMVTHKNIEKILSKEKSLAKANLRLVEEANKNGGDDNITVVSLEFQEAASKKKRNSSLGLLYSTIIGYFQPWMTESPRRFNSLKPAINK